MEAEKSGKFKVTVEVELNQALMDLINQEVTAVAEMAAKGHMFMPRMFKGMGMKKEE